MIFKFFQTKSRVEVWLHDDNDMRIEGQIIGFDEFMNTVLDDAVEVNVKKNTRRPIGKLVLKGDSIALICNISSE
jgi:small nuclear ribonucleoprotein E